MLKDGTKIPAKHVARWFLNHADREAGEALTQLKLQKLVYYADAWFLANFDKPMISDEFEAWAHGPAIRSLYAKYREAGWDSLPPETGPMPPEEVNKFLTSVYEEYGQYSAKKLEEMTHNELPWKDARSGLRPEEASRNVISKLAMRNFYAERINKKAISKLQD
jgi:uncharacterized phage-associated protein